MPKINKYAYLGFRGLTMEEVAEVVNEVLGVAMLSRESDFAGYYFSVRTPDGGQIKAVEGASSKETRGHKDITCVLSINKVEGSDEMVFKLQADPSSPILLRTSEIVQDE